MLFSHTDAVVLLLCAKSMFTPVFWMTPIMDSASITLKVGTMVLVFYLTQAVNRTCDTDHLYSTLVLNHFSYLVMRFDRIRISIRPWHENIKCKTTRFNGHTKFPWLQSWKGCELHVWFAFYSLQNTITTNKQQISSFFLKNLVTLPKCSHSHKPPIKFIHSYMRDACLPGFISHHLHISVKFDPINQQ